MTTLTNTGALKHLEGKEKLLLRLVELSVTLNSTLDLEELLQLITATATEALNCEAASILLYDERHPRLYFAAATGSNPAKLAEIPVPIDNSLAGTIFRTNQPMILNNADQDPRHFPLVADHINIKVKTLLEAEGRDDLSLRIAVQPGGCSGLRYQLYFDDRSLDGDIVKDFGGVDVVTDRMSAPYLSGATIDFVDTIEKQGFTIDNPNATGSCACGDSFS